MASTPSRRGRFWQKQLSDEFLQPGFNALPARGFFGRSYFRISEYHGKIQLISFRDESRFFVSCFFMPMTGMFTRMAEGKGGNGGGIALLFWCIYFLPIGVLAYRHFSENRN